MMIIQSDINENGRHSKHNFFEIYFETIPQMGVVKRKEDEIRVTFISLECFTSTTKLSQMERIHPEIEEKIFFAPCQNRMMNMHTHLIGYC